LYVITLLLIPRQHLLRLLLLLFLLLLQLFLLLLFVLLLFLDLVVAAATPYIKKIFI